jgi:hypothetical protein
VEQNRSSELGQTHHESHSVYYSEEDPEDEFIIRETLEFEETRKEYI